MVEYNFAPVSVLIVEDNAFIGKMIRDILQRFKVGGVTLRANGSEAIEVLKRAPVGSIDLVVSDYVMNPIDGLLFLRWLRNAEDSPNRFLPFIMLSGAADYSHVNAARDMGASEFLAKPFSIQTIAERLLTVIDNPRQFVMTQHFFGPDRRRQQTLIDPKTEQRKTKPEDITVVHSPTHIDKPENPTEVWYFQLPNGLKEKVGGMGAQGPGTIPVDLLVEAEEHLQRESLDFTDWALEYLNELAEHCEDALSKPERRGFYFEKINMLAHELRGQGGTFGYPLITEFGKMLYDCTAWSGYKEDVDVEIAKAHIDAMRAVLRDKISGTGGKTGRELLTSLELAIKKQRKAAGRPV